MPVSLIDIMKDASKAKTPIDFNNLENNHFKPVLMGLVDEYNRHMEAISSRSTSKIEGTLFSFFGSPLFQAYAMPLGENYNIFRIYYNVGIFLTLNHVFCEICKTKGLPIGLYSTDMPNKNLRKPQKLGNSFLDTMSWCNQNDVKIGTNSYDVAILTAHLEALAGRFLFHHEITHLMHAHIHLKKGNLHLGAEFPALEDEPIETGAILYQTLEWDADCCAASRSIQEAVRGPINPEFNKLQPNAEDGVYYWTFANHILFRVMAHLCGGRMMATPKCLVGTHPPVLVRHFSARCTAADALKRRGLLSYEKFALGNEKGILDAEIAWRYIWGEGNFDFDEIFLDYVQLNRSPFNFANMGDASAHMKLLWVHWNKEVRSQLVGRAFSELPQTDLSELLADTL